MARRVKRILNCLPSQGTETDWGADRAMAPGVMRRRVPLFDVVDLRADWWEVGDQGSTGSCVGWASTDAVFRWHMVKAGRIAEAERLSVRYVWMAAKEIDEYTSEPSTFLEYEGTSLKSALDVARKLGLVLEPVLPFGRAKLYQGDAPTFYGLASELRIGAYYNLQTNAQAWRLWLNDHGPILTRLNVDATWENATATGGKLDVYQGPGQGGHAVALVGYTPEHFIVRNSWGTDWGDQGFGYASLAYAAAAFSEAYGVTV
jgi:hypothetical protein